MISQPRWKLEKLKEIDKLHFSNKDPSRASLEIKMVAIYTHWCFIILRRVKITNSLLEDIYDEPTRGMKY